jgi:uncharacterized protein YvpB
MCLALTATLAACSPGAGSGTASAARTSGPATGAQLAAVGDRIMPHHPQYDFYVECINFTENGVLPASGNNDYSACPITRSLESTMSKTGAHFCPCDQNVSRDRSINVSPTDDGGVITILLYLGQVKVQLKAVWTDGKLLVDDLAAKGDFEIGPVAFQNKPGPTPNNTPPPPATPTPESFPVPTSRVLNVPWYHQVYELSCEEAALRMALAYEGIATTDDAVYAIVGDDPRGPTFDGGAMHWGDPYTAFVGNINGSEVALTGYGTYYPTITKAATTLGGTVLRSGEGIGPADVYQAVLEGHPVETWVTYQWVLPGRRDYVAFDGRTIPYAGPVEHAVVVAGVDPGRVLINDPWYGPGWISKPTFEAAYGVYNQMAVILQ